MFFHPYYQMKPILGLSLRNRLQSGVLYFMRTCVKVNFSVWVKRVPLLRTSPPAAAPPNDCSSSARSEVDRWAPWESGRGCAAAWSCSSIRRCRRDRFLERYSYRSKERRHQRQDTKACMTHRIEGDWTWLTRNPESLLLSITILAAFLNTGKLPVLGLKRLRTVRNY